MYVSRVFAVWYVAFPALCFLSHPVGPYSEKEWHEQLLSDTCGALLRLDSPLAYSALHKQMEVVYTSIQVWLSIGNEEVPVDLLEDLQIIGVKIKREMNYLGLDYTRIM